VSGRVGLWLVGVRGSVGTTAVAGLAASRAGMAAATGLVTEHQAMQDVPLPELSSIVMGGHDITTTSLTKRAEQLVAAGVLPAGLPLACADELEAAESRVRHGYVTEDGDQYSQVLRLADDLREFARQEQLDHVVVINVSSTEPIPAANAAHESLAALQDAWARGEAPLPVSSAYAAAAFLAGCAFADFTPSTGARLPALVELANRQGMPWAGSDGKTGETLLKSVLAPMFDMRALRVRSWAGTNLLGGGDGATLADPEACASKTTSKVRGLQAMLGHPVDGPVHIDYIPDLGDWKTAWDHISFEGFLGTRMTLQFTWQGCDSSLAAPLVLDLGRLLALALSRGVAGPVSALGFFFKDPVASDEHRLVQQWQALLTWAAESADGERA
jgi:myo-inositol-1-phosphate synthase